MAVSAPLVVILAVQAVPTLLFTSTLSSILLVFYLAAFALIGFYHLCSWCWAFFNDAAAKCSLHTSKLSNRSWWWSGGGEGGLAPSCSRGVQLAMLFLTLMLCFPPPMLGVNGESINGAERLVSLGDGPDTDTSSFSGAIREVTSKGTNEGETGPERRQDEVNNNNVLMPTSSFDSSGSPAAKEELQSCRALVRARTGQVTCGGSPAAEAVVGGSSSSSEVRDCSSKDETTLVEKLSSVSAAEALFFPSQLQFGMQPLYQRQVAFLTIMNSCNGSRLSLLAAKSDNRQFLVTGSFSTENPLLVAPGGALTFPVCYLPQYIGAAKGSITIETGRDKLVVQLQGEGVESLFKINVRVQPGKSHHYVLSLFNPYNETLLVEEVVILPENNYGGIKTKVSSELDDDGIVIEAGESTSTSTSSSTHNKERGMLMRAGETWDLPAQTMKDIVDFNILLESEEFLQGAFQIRVVGPALGDKSVTLVYPFTSRVSRPSPVMSIPDMLDFGWLVGDQASSQPLILQNSGHQSLKVEDIYEVQGDPRIAIDYEKGRILRPGLETEVANITFKGHNQPRGSNACRRRMQRIVVRTNSTIGHLIEIAYRAIVLQCLDSPSPAMAFVTGSTGGAAVREFGGQGISDLLMDYKLLMVLLFCGVVVSLLVYFQVVVTDTDLPTISGDLGKGRSSCSSSSVTPFMKRRDKILKMWGWGALATVVDGIWAACGSALWRKDCSTSSNPDYDLPRSLTPADAAASAAAQAPAPAPPVAAAQTEAQTPKPSPVSTSTTPQVGKGGRSDKKGGSSSGAAKADHHKLPVTTRDSSHHPPSVKQPKASKFLRSEHPKQHSSFIETSSVDAVVDAPVVIKQTPVVAAPPAAEIEALPSAGLTSKDTSFSSAQKTQPAVAAAPPVVERERRRRKKKSVHVAATTTSPASPASPVTPSAAAAAAWPLSPKKSDPSLSPRSSGSAADLVDVPAAPPLPKLKVKVLHAPNKAAVVAPASTTPVQQQQQRGGKAVSADHHRKQQQQQGVGVNKRSNFSEWAAAARKKTPPGGGDGSQSYRRSREAYVAAAAAEDINVGGASACFTTSASFPRLNARQGWVNPLRDSSVVPPPAIAPALRAPGAKITKPQAAESTSETGWTSLGFTANPEFQAPPWHASSPGELPGAYDIWGNHFGNFGSQCSSSEVESKEVVNGLHKLLVPEHVVHECDQQLQGIMSPHGTEIYRAPFSGFFSEGVDSRPGSPALPDQLYPVFGHTATTALPVVRPRVRVRVPVPYSPPMGSCVATTVFSTSAFNSPLSTPTPTNSNSHSTSSSNCSFWAHESNTSKNNFPERVVSPTLSLT